MHRSRCSIILSYSSLHSHCSVRSVEMISQLPCPPCQFYDNLVNDCIDPCRELGSGSRYCARYGCPTTTAVDATTLQTWPITTRQLSANNLTIFVVIVIIAVGLLIGLGLLFWRHQRRRRSDARNEGRTLHLSVFKCYSQNGCTPNFRNKKSKTDTYMHTVL